ncbi:CheY chemotaxis protein or a CheY-like REC (receiver) domain [Granulicella rosea]|uniref:CheY chemotaxis protein or a CheY-like REC (Receiver) domain n=1 Tax=Granulicella rosea TaxID=474952 RepID=A0A239D5U2_9BACT|nr:response regulator [Granulicella rosea]SNS26953.1 CheY chemotaxis protein or a CheY-like REC (receiver) domain [Granulicella rosea]
MTSEQNVPEVEVHQGPPQVAQQGFNHNAENDSQDGGEGSDVPHGQGQSKSSRRRRRKRKGKSTDAAAAGSDATPSAEGSGDAAPAEAGGNQQPGQGRSFQANAGQQQNGSQQNGANPAGTKRWKKKNFRERDGRGGGGERNRDNIGNQASSNGGGQQNQGAGFRDGSTHQPGNNAGGFKRKNGGFGKQQQQRNGGGGNGGSRGGFVGPMDHSYRVVNGNFADTPPSTIETGGNGNYGGRSRGGGGGYQSDSQPIDYSQGRTIPIREDAPTKIYFFIEDLFFLAKISETARKLGVKVGFAKNEKEQIAALTSASEEERPGLIVFDLNNANAKPLTLIPKLKAKLKKSTSIIGFLSHLQGDLKAKAVEAGCDTVMPRAAFSQNLPNLLRRYGIEEVEEANYNQ